MGELLQHKLPSLLLLQLVHPGGDEGHEAAAPHAGAAGDNGGGEGRAGVVNELARGVEALAAMAEETWSIGFRVEVEEECAKDHSKTAVEDIKAVLELNCRGREGGGGRGKQRGRGKWEGGRERVTIPF